MINQVFLSETEFRLHDFPTGSPPPLLLLPCFKNTLTWVCVDRSLCCHGNCQSVIWSIHLACTSTASSSPGTPLSLPNSSKRVCVCVCVCVRTPPQASPLHWGWSIFPFFSKMFFSLLLCLIREDFFFFFGPTFLRENRKHQDRHKAVDLDFGCTNKVQPKFLLSVF